MFNRDFYVESKLKGRIEIDIDMIDISSDFFDFDLLKFLYKFGAIKIIGGSGGKNKSYSFIELSIPLVPYGTISKCNKVYHTIDVNDEILNRVIFEIDWGIY